VTCRCFARVSGFRHQVEQHWPVNPVQVLVEKLRALAVERSSTNNNTNKKKLVVADFGCGDAELAKQLLHTDDKKDDNKEDNNNPSNSCPFTVHSFDLVARGPNAHLITACDCAHHVPLPSQSVDVGIFCLSLMGTNLADFVREAHRVLKDAAPDGGRLHIAEVRSRFESNNNNNSHKNKKKRRDKEKDPLQTFIGALEKLGFRCVDTDRSNKMFVLLELRKNGKKPNKDLSFTAKPCIYKRR